MVFFSHDKNFVEDWNLVTGESVIKNWFQMSQKIKSSNLSDAGRTSQQVIQSLGFDGIDILANKHIIELLNNISKKELKSYKFEKFEGKIKEAINLSSGGKTQTLEKDILKILIKK